jgi:beta-barrel assembly-enhancing protease
MMRNVIALSLMAVVGSHFAAAAEARQLPGGLTKGLGIAKKANDVRELEFTDAEEQELGKQVSQRIRERYGVVQSEAVHRYVSLVGLAMAQGSTRPNLPWTFIVLDTDGVNAFAAPGGYVHITRGALALIQDEAQLAGVLAHEIIHVTEKHTIRAIQKSQAVGMAAADRGGMLKLAVGAAYENIIDRGFGRADENEGDEKGVAIASKTGYAPNGLVVFLTTLKDRNKTETTKNGLFASHPDLDERLNRIKKQIAAQKLTATATLQPRYAKNITYKPTPLTSLASVEEGSAGLVGGGAKPAEKKPEEKKAEEPKKRGLGLGRLMPTGGGESKQAQVTASGGARGVDKEKLAPGGPNKEPVAVKIAATEVAAFRKEGGLS